MTQTRARGRPRHPDILTPAEWRVVDGVRHGMTNRQIALGRGISLDAVKQHVATAIAKLELRDRAALRMWHGAPIGSALRAITLHNKETMMSEDLQLGVLGQISRNVQDVKRSEAWFKDVLGLKHLYSFPSSVGDLAFFDLGGTRLFLSQREDGREPGLQNVLYFRVADINSAHARMRSQGVEFIDAPHMIFKHPDGTEEWMVFFKDCDGQTLALMSQVKA